MKKKKLLTDKSGSLYEKMIDDAAKQMAEEIDAEMIRTLYKDFGWHEVKLWPMIHEKGISIDEWTTQHVKHGMWTKGLVWMFENENEANWFKLRWLS
jgi:hypothetical protein